MGLGTVKLGCLRVRIARIAFAVLATTGAFVADVAPVFMGETFVNEAFAAPFTGSFDALRAELQRRSDEDYTSTLSAAQRKQLAAVTASLARIDGPHASIEDDARTLRVVAGRLLKAFRVEFTGADPGPLAGLVAGTAVGLLDAAETQYGALTDAIATLVEPSVVSRVQALATSARRDLDAAARPGTAVRTAAGLALRAARTIAKANALVSDARSSRLTFKIGSQTVTGSMVTGTVGLFRDLPIVDVTAEVLNPVTNRAETFVLRLNGEALIPMEIGPFVLGSGGNGNFLYVGTGVESDDYYFSQFAPRSTGTITAFSTTEGTATGTFSCYLERVGDRKLTMTQGSFRIVTGEGVTFAK